MSSNSFDFNGNFGEQLPNLNEEFQNWLLDNNLGQIINNFKRQLLHPQKNK